MITNYYLPKERITGQVASLPPEEARHAIQVLRRKMGDEITAVDGEGGWYRLALTRVDRRDVLAEVIESRREVGEPAYTLTIAMALLKNQKRFDFFVEKASELGVSRIIPMTTARTEKRAMKQGRVENVLVAAMKQCGRSRLVHYTPVQPFGEVVQQTRADLYLCCHEKAPGEASFSEIVAKHNHAREIVILIGPEGGFAEEEVAVANERAYHVVSMGTRRLRAETAAIAASTGVMLLKL